VLVPYPAAADDHQSYNARIFEQAGAARLLVESKTTPETMHQVVSEILTNAPMRQTMTEAARGLAGVDAAKRVAEEIEASCNRK
jgi:UDP-N-acetylglucosamine--N-acetylmuramyl-(pentapeptide) pyrophosphoryl-undecaprenol N-acetylglucosamine transferase